MIQVFSIPTRPTCAGKGTMEATLQLSTRSETEI